MASATSGVTDCALLTCVWIARPTPRLRAVVVLFDVYGLRHEEIAETLEMTAGAAKVQLHRGRRRLRELLT